jgi:hypothetical protein
VTCRSGCPSPGTHANWGECARAASFQIGDLGHGVKKTTDTRLKAYADARRQGLQPPTTKLNDSIATMQKAGA